MLAKLVYVSTANLRGTHDAIELQVSKILSQSFLWNERVGVTGMLLYSGGFFLQLLEGEESALDETFARIEADSRHRNIRVLMRQPLEDLYLANFPMGCAGIEQTADPIIEEAARARGWTETSSLAPAAVAALLRRVPMPDRVMQSEDEFWRSTQFWKPVVEHFSDSSEVG